MFLVVIKGEEVGVPIEDHFALKVTVLGTPSHHRDSQVLAKFLVRAAGHGGRVEKGGEREG